MLPRYAAPLVEARRHGRKPTDLVIVSDGVMGLHRQFPQNPVVLADRHIDPWRYEWSFLNGLEVEVATAVLDGHTIALVEAIGNKARPYYLRLRHVVNDVMQRYIWNYTRDFRPETDAALLKDLDDADDR